MKNKLYMFFYGITIRKYSKNDLNNLYLENVYKINKLQQNSYYRHILVMQNRCIKKRLDKLCNNAK